jgi:uncharacterized membrane protein YagU involved in acid resistance
LYVRWPHVDWLGEASAMDRRKDTLLADIAIGLFAGLVATKVTGFVGEALARPMPEGVKEHEERLRPEPTSRVAARKAAEALGYRLEGRRLELATMTVHYGLGLSWGPVYGLLRRHGRMRPLPAGFATGAAMSLVMDEVLVPALGLSPPNRAFPAVTHVRGFLNHLGYGAAAALTAKAVYRLTGTTLGPR